LRKGRISNPIELIANGKDAVKFLLNPSKVLPMLVILDLELIGHDGLWVLEQMQANAGTRLIPVIVFTHSDDQEDRIRSYGLGANVYIRKPISSETLQQHIKDIGLYWLLTNTPPPEGFF
jgi:DNA-binding response OmpR family regulator